MHLQWLTIISVMIAIVMEIEKVHQIANRGAIQWHVWIAKERNGVGKIVSAACRKRVQIPVPFDELQDRNVIRVRVVDVAALRPG